MWSTLGPLRQIHLSHQFPLSQQILDFYKAGPLLRIQTPALEGATIFPLPHPHPLPPLPPLGAEGRLEAVAEDGNLYSLQNLNI